MGLNTITRTAQDVIDDVKRTFGDEANVQVSDNDIIRWINSAQREIITQNPILRAVATSDITGGVSEYALSELNILSIQSIQYKGRKLQAMSFQEAEEYIMENDPDKVSTGFPIIWYEWAGTINLWPVPQDTIVGGLKVYYVKMPDNIGQEHDLQVPDLYYENIVQFVLSKAYELDEDTENSNFKIGQFNERMNTLAEKESTFQNDTYPRITILDEDAW